MVPEAASASVSVSVLEPDPEEEQEPEATRPGGHSTGTLVSSWFRNIELPHLLVVTAAVIAAAAHDPLHPRSCSTTVVVALITNRGLGPMDFDGTSNDFARQRVFLHLSLCSLCPLWCRFLHANDRSRSSNHQTTTEYTESTEY